MFLVGLSQRVSVLARIRPPAVNGVLRKRRFGNQRSRQQPLSLAATMVAEVKPGAFRRQIACTD
jgi:hypothetical protein